MGLAATRYLHKPVHPPITCHLHWAVERKFIICWTWHIFHGSPKQPLKQVCYRSIRRLGVGDGQERFPSVPEKCRHDASLFWAPSRRGGPSPTCRRGLSLRSSRQPAPLSAVTATSRPQQHFPSWLNNTRIFQWAQERGNQLEDKVPLFHIYLSMPSFQTNFLTGLFSRDGHFRNQLERARHRKVHFSPRDCFQSLLKKERHARPFYLSKSSVGSERCNVTNLFLTTSLGA